VPDVDERVIQRAIEAGGIAPLLHDPACCAEGAASSCTPAGTPLVEEMVRNQLGVAAESKPEEGKLAGADLSPTPRRSWWQVLNAPISPPAPLIWAVVVALCVVGLLGVPPSEPPESSPHAGPTVASVPFPQALPVVLDQALPRFVDLAPPVLVNQAAPPVKQPFSEPWSPPLPTARSRPSPLDRLDLQPILRQEGYPHLTVELGEVERGLAQACSATFSPDGRTLLVGGLDHAIRLFQTEGPALREGAVLSGHTGRVVALACSGDGKTLASVDSEKKLHLWRLAPGKPRELTIPPDLPPLEFLVPWDMPMALSPDGETLALGGHPAAEGGRAWFGLWDLRGQQPRKRFFHQYAPAEGPLWKWSTVAAVAFAPDGRSLAVASFSRPEHLALWDLGGETPRERDALSPCGLGGLAFSPDGRLLARGQNDFLRICDLSGKEGREIASFNRSGSEDYVWLRFTPDGRTLLAASLTGRIVLLDPTARGKPQGFQLPMKLRCVAFAPDGRHLATVTDDGDLYVLRLGQADASFLYQRGLGHARRKENEQAIAAFTDAIQLDPKNAQAYHERGLARARRGDYAAAKKDLEQAAKLDPTRFSPDR
jgi:hypothetical protein